MGHPSRRWCLLQELCMLSLLHGYFMECTPVSESSLKVNCSIPSVSRGKQTKLTCSFQDDLQDSRKDVVVRFYKNDKEDEIADCFYLESGYTCKISKPFYWPNSTISRSLTLLLPNSTEESEGTYSCQILPAYPHQIQPCTFRLENSTDADIKDNLTMIQQTTVKSTSNKMRNQAQKQYGELNPGIIASIFLAMVLTVVMIASLHIYRRRLHRNRNWICKGINPACDDPCAVYNRLMKRIDCNSERPRPEGMPSFSKINTFHEENKLKDIDESGAALNKEEILKDTAVAKI